jgi:hypothetical protein
LLSLKILFLKLFFLETYVIPELYTVLVLRLLFLEILAQRLIFLNILVLFLEVLVLRSLFLNVQALRVFSPGNNYLKGPTHQIRFA